MSQKYRVASVSYNSIYKVIGKHPDGRIFAIRHDGTPGLYVVDRDLNLVATLNTTLPNHQYFSDGNSINECVILKTGTMLCWGIYRTTSRITTIYRSDDLTYSSFSPVFTLPSDICFIEKSVGVSAKDDTVMCCEYTMAGYEAGAWLPPLQLNIWRGTNDGKDWEVVHTMNRNPQFAGDIERIRHFHAVRYDPYEDLFWITTGDNGVETGILTIKPDGTDVTRIGQGVSGTDGHEWRATALMFTKDYVHYGCDAYIYGNHNFRRINRITRNLETLTTPDDCIRTSGRFSTPWGDLFVSQKSYEKSPSNTGLTTELYFCDDFQNGDWYSAYEWDVGNSSLISYFPQIISDGTGRFFVDVQNIKNESGSNISKATAILDIEEVDNMGWVKKARETYENIYYAPSLKDSGDMEAATKTITATAEASGTESADYSAVLTLPAPTDSRLIVKRICARLATTIDSMTAGHLYCKVYVDTQDADHLLFSKDWTSAATTLDAVDTYATSKATIFGLLNDGAEHTFYLFFWVDSGNAVLSLVQLWEAVGTCSVSSNVTVMQLSHIGMCSVGAYIPILGTGTTTTSYGSIDNPGKELQGHMSSNRYLFITHNGLLIMQRGTVATDLNYIHSIGITLRTLL